MKGVQLLTLHRHRRYTHTLLTHSNINSRLFAAHAEMHASANVVTHNTVDAKETPLGASASTTTWLSVLPYGHYGFAGQLGKGKLAGGAVTTLWLYGSIISWLQPQGGWNVESACVRLRAPAVATFTDTQAVDGS